MRKILGIVLVLALLVQPVTGQVLEDERVEAFNAIIEAEEVGADVSGLVSEYNMALSLIGAGDFENISLANQIFLGIVEEASVLRGEAITQGNLDAAIAIAKTIVLVAAAGVIWLRGDRWFWRFWRRTKQGYVVE